MSRMLVKWVVLLLLVGGSAARGESTLGLGALYFQTVDNLDKPFQEDGLAPTVSLRTDVLPLLMLQVDGVLYPDRYAGADKDVFSPQAFLLLGRGLYAGLGVGALISGGDVADQPFFAARAGATFRLFPALHLDVNANYEFTDWEGINELDERVDTDTVTLGAALRFLL